MANVKLKRASISIGTDAGGDVHVAFSGDVVPTSGLAGLDETRHADLVNDKVTLTRAQMDAFKRADGKSLLRVVRDLLVAKAKRHNRAKKDPDNTVTDEI